MTVPAVFDTVVLLQAAASPSGPAGRGLELVTAGVVVLSMTADGMAEIADVLGRPKVRRRLPNLTDESTTTFLKRLEASVTVVGDVPKVFEYPRDPKDEHIINLALASGAAYLVTRDHDLLDLMRPDITDGREFTARFPALTILDPVAFLAALRLTP